MSNGLTQTQRQPSAMFIKAEEDYLKLKREKNVSRNLKGARRRGDLRLTRNAVVLAETNVDFFSDLLTRDLERELWMGFITGFVPKYSTAGTQAFDENGKPVFEQIEPNSVSLKAFLRAVEYKRGMPIQVVKKDDDGKSPAIEVRIIGATEEFFEEQGIAKGLLAGATKVKV